MTTAVQRRRGTATEHSSFTGLEGELSVNTTNESVHVHDGSTAGGFELMRADGSNSSVTLGDISGVTAGTGLSGGGTSGTVTLDIDSTVTTLDGTQTLTNKTLTSPTLNTPTIGTSFTIGGATITEAELEILDGATVTTTELNYVDGVTSSIQTQIDAKAPLASPTFTGTVTMPTVDINAGSIDGTAIGASSASTGAFTTLTATGLTVDTNTLYVDSTNNRVGIGTTSPDEALEVSGDVKSSGGSFGIYHFGETSDVTKIVGRDGGHGSFPNTMDFFTNSTQRMRIDSSGRVGIGTTSPSSLYTGANNLVVGGGSSESGMTIYSSSTTDGNIYFADGTSGSAPYSGFLEYNHSSDFFRVGVNAAERMRIDSSGNLLVGRTSTAGSLTDHGHQLYNSGLYYLYSSATGNSDAFRMYDGNGTLRATIDGDGDYTDLSDVRAKENIVNAPSVLSTINDLQVRSFTWKVDGKHQTYGFVAQELNEAIPEAVSLPEEEDGMWGVKHAKLVPVLVKAIQEQQTLIESLTARIAALEE